MHREKPRRDGGAVRNWIKTLERDDLTFEATNGEWRSFFLTSFEACV
jgi:hypothetical protein